MKSYIKFIGRNKLYTAIEATGLAISLAFVILTGTYVWQQYAISRQNPDRDRIFVYASDELVGMSFWDKEDIDMNIPEVELTTRYMIDEEVPVKVADEEHVVNVSFVDPEFFEMFPQFHLIDGTAEALKDKSNIIISKTFANKIAEAGKSPIGMSLNYQMNETYTVAGIVDDIGNSLFINPDIILNTEASELAEQISRYSVVGNVYTFLRTKEGTNIDLLRSKCADLMGKTHKRAYKSRLIGLEELYFTEESYMTLHVSKSMLNVLLAVVIALLLSAGFNYINLSSALIGKRAKEMATRRLLGENRKQLFINNIIESIGFTAICLGFAFLIAELFKPTMERLLQGENPINLKYSPLAIFIYILGAILLGTIVGIFPSIQASRYKPIDVIKGSLRRHNKMFFSKIFIIIQNALSVILISVAILMEIQLGHMIHRPVNADSDNLFHLQCSLAAKHLTSMEDRLTQLPCVKKISHSSSVPGHINMTFKLKTDTDETINTRIIFCDSIAFNLFNFKKIDDYDHPLSGSLWLSESAAAKLGLCDTTEALILRRMGNLNGVGCQYIGGIYKDIPAADASAAQESPISAVYVVSPERINMNRGLLILTTDESQQTKDAILTCFSEYIRESFGMPVTAHNNDFMNNFLSEGLKPAKNTIRLVEIFMFLAVLLSLLGLIAMSTYYAGQNTKDIAIRKVFGGTVNSETIGNVKSYMVMVLISCIIGVPIAIYIGTRYLQNFAYRVENWWWACAVAVVLSLLISFLSVLWQTLRAARTDPAKELKKE